MLCSIRKQKKQAKNERLMKIQRVFSSTGASFVGATSSILKRKEQITNAEVLQALNMVDSNHSFSFTNGDSDRFWKMFPDSQIAAKYSQEEIKSKYGIQFGLTHFVLEQLMDDIHDAPFSFKFDNTTTLQITIEETVEAIRLVKDYLVLRGGVNNIQVSKEMIRSCGKARGRYGLFLEQKKKTRRRNKCSQRKREK